MDIRIRVWWAPIFKELLEKDCKLVLDLGCGSGWATLYLRAKGVRSIGLDIEPQEYFVLTVAHYIPFRSNPFDCIIAFSVLEHLNNPVKALREIYRVLKNNGFLMVTIPTPNKLLPANNI